MTDDLELELAKTADELKEATAWARDTRLLLRDLCDLLIWWNDGTPSGDIQGFRDSLLDIRNRATPVGMEEAEQPP